MPDKFLPPNDGPDFTPPPAPSDSAFADLVFWVVGGAVLLGVFTAVVTIHDVIARIAAYQALGQ